MATPARTRVLGAALSAALTTVVLVGGWSEPAEVKTEVRPVRTIVVDPKPIEDDRQAVGEIRPRQESDLGFRVSGKVVSRAVDVGNSVKAGDLLARLDEQDFQNRLRSAEADVTSADAVLTEATGTEERQEQLLTKGVTTRSNYDAAVKNKRSAEAQLESARAALDLAKDQLKYTELKADFDGIVTAIGAEPWDAVISATQHRLRPILFTAAAAMLGMLPIAPMVFWGPMAFAVIGGLMVATLLTLVFLPALYVTWFRIKPKPSEAGSGKPALLPAGDAASAVMAS